MKNHSTNLLLLLLTLALSISSCTDGPKEATNTKSEGQSATTSSTTSSDKIIDDHNNSSANFDLETSIKDIKARFQDTEQNLKSFTKKNTAIFADGSGEPDTHLTGYYDEDGIPRKILKEEAMGHSASLTSYYMNNGAMYFIFEQSTSEASVMGPFTFSEKRIYLNDGKVIRLLEKEQTVKGNDNPKLSKVPNKDITATLKDKSSKAYIDQINVMLIALADAD